MNLTTQETSAGVETLAERLQAHAAADPRGDAFIHLKDGETESRRMSWHQLDLGARSVAARLVGRHAPGERALLLYRAGLDFVVAFLGCLYARVIPVAAPADMLGRRGRTLAHLLAVFHDAKPSVVLSTGELLATIAGLAGHAPGLLDIAQLDTTTIEPETGAGWRPGHEAAGGIAYLQYSSGSTAAPKGVAIGQYQLVNMLDMLTQAYGYDSRSSFVCWMPHYHDYGLVQGLLHPIHAGIPCIVMSPVSFVQRPVRWLAALTRHRATHSAGPNFAYDQCLRKVTQEQCVGLDLSAWRMAASGAEPIRQGTVWAFAEKFAPFGFRGDSFYPSYGLAEATLIVSGPKRVATPPFLPLRAGALERGRVEIAGEGEAGVRHIAGCGAAGAGVVIRIVNPDSRTAAAPGEVGEVWAASKALALGYWQRPEETRDIFDARIADTGEGPFLRTGDLGFLEDGELYIVGRRKDLIILSGANHHPEEIEWTVEGSHPQVRQGSAAAFTIDDDDGSHLVVLVEVSPSRVADPADRSAVIRSIRKAIALEHGLQVDRLILLGPGAVEKTTSGKIQRAACRAALLAGRLSVLQEG